MRSVRWLILHTNVSYNSAFICNISHSVECLNNSNKSRLLHICVPAAKWILWCWLWRWAFLCKYFMRNFWGFSWVYFSSRTLFYEYFIYIISLCTICQLLNQCKGSCPDIKYLDLWRFVTCCWKSVNKQLCLCLSLCVYQVFVASLVRFLTKTPTLSRSVVFLETKDLSECGGMPSMRSEFD